MIEELFGIARLLVEMLAAWRLATGATAGLLLGTFALRGMAPGALGWSVFAVCVVAGCIAGWRWQWRHDARAERDPPA